MGLSESLILLLTASVVLVALRFWRTPSVRLAVTLGLLCGLAALTRAEQVLLIVVVLLPLTLLLRDVGLRHRLALGAVGTLTALVLMAPWVGFNLSRFSHPTTFSNDAGSTLAMANCRPAYRDGYLGSGDFVCLERIKAVPGDESAQDAHQRQVAMRYIDAHLGRLPVVLLARPAREFGVFAPIGQVKLEATVNKRPLVFAEIGLGLYYLMIVGGIYGAIIVRRRRLHLGAVRGDLRRTGPHGNGHIWTDSLPCPF